MIIKLVQRLKKQLIKQPTGSSARDALELMANNRCQLADLAVHHRESASAHFLGSMAPWLHLDGGKQCGAESATASTSVAEVNA